MAIVVSAMCGRAQFWHRSDMSGVRVAGLVRSQESLTGGLVVALEEMGGSGGRQMADVSSGGEFSFTGIPEGSYRLSVRDMYGNVLQEEFVTVNQSMPPVSVRLPERKINRPVNGTISVARLAHKVPKQARHELEKAVKDESMQKYDSAIVHLQKAVKIDPEYMEAYNNLGVRYLRKKKYGKALDQFAKAAALDAHASLPPLNSAYALMAMQRYPEAEQNARRALDLDPVNRQARYLLAFSMWQQRKDSPRMIKDLEQVSPYIPQAYLVAAQIFAARGKPDAAREQIKQYIASGSKENLEMATTWLTRLDRAQSAR